MTLRATILTGLALAALAGCGGDTKTVTATRTTAAAPATTQAQATVTTEAAPEPEPEADPAEARQEFYLAIDDVALAADSAIDAQLDGEDRIKTLTRLRTEALDLQADLLLATQDAPTGANDLVGAITDARVAARAGDLPALIQARRDARTAREAITRWALGDG